MRQRKQGISQVHNQSSSFLTEERRTFKNLCVCVCICLYLSVSNLGLWNLVQKVLNQIHPYYTLWIWQRLHKKLIRSNKLQNIFYYSFEGFFSPDFNAVGRCVSFLHLCNLKTKKIYRISGTLPARLEHVIMCQSEAVRSSNCWALTASCLCSGQLRVSIRVFVLCMSVITCFVDSTNHLSAAWLSNN